jgi:hypothetical protein
MFGSSMSEAETTSSNCQTKKQGEQTENFNNELGMTVDMSYYHILSKQMNLPGLTALDSAFTFKAEETRKKDTTSQPKEDVQDETTKVPTKPSGHGGTANQYGGGNNDKSVLHFVEKARAFLFDAIYGWVDKFEGSLRHPKFTVKG